MILVLGTVQRGLHLTLSAEGKCQFTNGDVSCGSHVQISLQVFLQSLLWGKSNRMFRVVHIDSPREACTSESTWLISLNYRC